MNDLISLISRGAAGAGVAAAGYFQPLLVLAVAALAALLVVGLVLPGVWSRQPAGRAAAQTTLQTLLRGALPLDDSVPPGDGPRT